MCIHTQHTARTHTVRLTFSQSFVWKFRCAQRKIKKHVSYTAACLFGWWTACNVRALGVYACLFACNRDWLFVWACFSTVECGKPYASCFSSYLSIVIWDESLYMLAGPTLSYFERILLCIILCSMMDLSFPYTLSVCSHTLALFYANIFVKR